MYNTRVNGKESHPMHYSIVEGADNIKPEDVVRLMKQTLVAFSGRPRLVGIDAGDDQDSVLHFLLQSSKPFQVFQYRLLVIRAAGADNQQKAV